MKKALLICTLLTGTYFANAQSTTFKPFKVDLAVGYAVPGGKGSKAGLVFAAEPKYAINDNISLGLRMEAAITARGYADVEGQRGEAEVKASGSYLATGDYYFNTNKFRPFAGLGIGVYRLAGASVEVTTEEPTPEEIEIKEDTKFGGAPRVGFEYGHFRTALEYNIVGKSEKINNNYFSIKLGFFIGGGRNK
ncbi:MAG TPA: outer membrane beta-barrel protein [Flavisolibacter sp.]|nr:outer membrane beta-barrel protein [Flavisolibacter sp.]